MEKISFVNFMIVLFFIVIGYMLSQGVFELLSLDGNISYTDAFISVAFFYMGLALAKIVWEESK